ncbi:Cytochrome B562 [Paramixta manurensis]|uniref:Cytochrome B562 n=1 Tax=Paramixta manurensis TaxID=2740817 RepID=A0A6M8UK21_9GAMM|nr:Cytochrome B562 [Erwiniaceae bacterium PD-1]
MRKHVIAMLSVSLLCTSVSALARDLGDDMDIIASNYKTVNKTTDAGELTKALQVMRDAATDAKQATPEKLESEPKDSPKLKDYQAGLDTLIGQIDTSMALAKAGKVDEAKDAAKKLADIRNENHKKFR